MRGLLLGHVLHLLRVDQLLNEVRVHIFKVYLLLLEKLYDLLELVLGDLLELLLLLLQLFIHHVLVLDRGLDHLLMIILGCLLSTSALGSDTGLRVSLRGSFLASFLLLLLL